MGPPAAHSLFFRGPGEYCGCFQQGSTNFGGPAVVSKPFFSSWTPKNRSALFQAPRLQFVAASAPETSGDPVLSVGLSHGASPAGCKAASPLVGSIARSPFPLSCDPSQEEPSSANALCYPEVLLQDEAEEVVAHPGPPDAPLSPAPKQEHGLARTAAPALLPSPEALSSTRLAALSEPTLELWRHGAASAVLRAEEKYRQAWEDLQRAEIRLLSTKRIAAELEAVSYPEGNSFPLPPQSLPPLGFVEELESFCADHRASELSPSPSVEEPLVDLEYDAGVWCIEACGAEGHSDPGTPAGVAEAPAVDDEVLGAEGAIARSRAALDSAARDLISRLEDEEDLQAQVMNRHIDALDQGAQHQVARWLVEEMNAASRSPELPPEPGMLPELTLPLDLDLAMRGYDEHAVRFLRHLPYDQVMTIRTIPPSSETRRLSSASPVAEDLERLLAMPTGRLALPAPLTLSSPGQVANRGPPSDLLGTGQSSSGKVLHPPLLLENPEDQNPHPSPVPSPSGDTPVLEPSARRGRARNKYQSKLVLLGCAVSSLSAYMVANFELVALAKDASVIVLAMSLAFVAAQFVWRSSGERRGTLLKVATLRGFGEEQAALKEGRSLQGGGSASSAVAYPDPEQVLPNKPWPLVRNVYRRGPSWDEVIWILGGLAVVLSLSTMVALACKALQAGLTFLSALTCSLVIQVMPQSILSAASSTLVVSRSSSPSIVRQVSSSLWLVLGGDLLSSGVEALGSAAAWAMLLLCVAFSIASAPVCLASSTSRRVSELLAFARSHASTGPSSEN